MTKKLISTGHKDEAPVKIAIAESAILPPKMVYIMPYKFNDLQSLLANQHQPPHRFPNTPCPSFHPFYIDLFTFMGNRKSVF
ncbi:MAG TPA: hypothetical protein VGJ93_11295 [Desulfuromonadaceae bacterium]|jgi:hypothetical protein